MLIPYNTDAPLYHYPAATVGLIVVNVLLYFALPPQEMSGIDELRFESQVNERLAREALDIEQLAEAEIERIINEELAKLEDAVLHPDWRMLHFGSGLKPWQWLTANFMHADILHLIGNMIFLWGLGLVVEGKLGWWRFLTVYLLMGVIGYGVVQVMMLGASHGNALGASLPIYGVMVLALLWAPLNELNCVYFFGRWMGFTSVSILLFSLGYLALQVGIFFLSGMRMGSEALHLVGALAALPIGLVMLQRGWVDCEDYDAISVWRGRHQLTREERGELRESSAEYQAKVERQRAAMLEQVRQIVAEGGDPALAWTAHLRMRGRFADWQLPEATLRGLIRLYHQQGRQAESVPALRELLSQSAPERTIDARLVLAQYLIREGERPRQGLYVLAALGGTPLTASQQAARDKLARLAEQRKVEIEIEEPVEPW